jgi:hypothetical protein
VRFAKTSSSLLSTVITFLFLAMPPSTSVIVMNSFSSVVVASNAILVSVVSILSLSAPGA